ncbi:MAG: hypothetical protein WC209_01220 [Ignavibacteriaceae bacterium]|jgi:hypothetical protein
MARAKMYCLGKNRDGSSCRNWALRGSYYCSSHQGQVTEQDVSNMKSAQNWSTLIIWIIFIVLVLISFAAGCEKQLFKYLSH